MVKRNYLSKTLREKYFSGSGLAEIDQKVLARTDNNIYKGTKWKNGNKAVKFVNNFCKNFHIYIGNYWNKYWIELKMALNNFLTCFEFNDNEYRPK